MDLKDVIKKPIISEKANEAISSNRYTFGVSPQANKKEITKAVEKFFNVHVKKVWSARISGKQKKAVVQLAEGEKIDLFKTGE